MMSQRLFNSAHQLAIGLGRQLEQQNKRIVFAESCTAGLASAILAQVPGISKWLCGSAVTYQEATKNHWLAISPELIDRHTAVSPEVTRAMAKSVLKRTSHADFSIAITGHLERAASADGPHTFVCAGYRAGHRVLASEPVRYNLHSRSRIERQWQAARNALEVAIEHLRFPPSADPTCVDWNRILGRPTDFPWHHWFLS